MQQQQFFQFPPLERVADGGFEVDSGGSDVEDSGCEVDGDGSEVELLFMTGISSVAKGQMTLQFRS